MNHEDSKSHFASICEYLWTRYDRPNMSNTERENMHSSSAEMARCAWNITVRSKGIERIKAELNDICNSCFGGEFLADIVLADASNIKLHEYPDDNAQFDRVEVLTKNGKPQAIVHLPGEPT